MKDVVDVIINQIKKILIKKGFNPDDFTFRECKCYILVGKNNKFVKIKYDKYKRKGVSYLKKVLCHFKKENDCSDPDLLLNPSEPEIPEPEIEERWIVHYTNPNLRISCPRSIKQQYKYDKVFNGFSCIASEEHMKKLKQTYPSINYIKDEVATITVIKDSIKIIDRNVGLKATNSYQTVGRFITRLGVNNSSRRAGTGTPAFPIDPNIYVFVIDTGIDTTHQDLNIERTLSRNFTSLTLSDWNDPHGHGTHVAGIIGAKDNTAGIVGVAPNVKVVAIRVLGADGIGYYSNIIAGLNYIISWKLLNPSKKAVVNMSLGGPASSFFDTAVKQVINANINVVVAAGNEGMNASTSSPARLPEAITVAAYNPSNNVSASWSNYGTLVDLQAPGVNIDSTYKGNSYALMSGTSMAAPMVAGAIACYMTRNPTVTARLTIRNAIVIAASYLTMINYNGTPASNPNISLTTLQSGAGTTKRSVYAGKY